jgi:ketosteroid isomerase-like protein
MSQENVEALRRGIAAFNRGEFEVFVETADPEIRVTTELIGTPKYRGREGVRQMLRDMAAAWESWKMEPVEFVERGDKVLMGIHATARGRTSGASVEARHFYVVDFRHGKAVRLQGFSERSEALEAAGLEE